MQCSCCLDNLPDEILHCIFKFLFLPTIQFKLTLVNKHWFHVINNSKFVQVYNMNANNILQYLNPNSDDDPMKLLFDWSELIIETYPDVYEGLHMLRKNIVSVNILPADHPVAELASSTQMVLIGKDQTKVTMYVNPTESIVRCMFYHYQHNNPKLVRGFIEYYYSYGYNDYDSGAEQDMDYLNEMFREYLALMPKGIFWGTIELLCTNYRPSQYAIERMQNTSKSSRYWIDYRQEKLSSDICELYTRKMQYLKDHNSLLRKAFASKQTSICQRLINNGYELTESDLKTCVTNLTRHHHPKSADTIKILLEYAQGSHRLDLVKREFERNLNGVFFHLEAPEFQHLLDYKISIPSEVYYYMEERPLEAYNKRIAFLREMIPDFYCPFGPTAPVLPQSEKHSGKRILVLYHNNYSKTNLNECIEIAAKNRGELLDSMIYPKLDSSSQTVPFVSELQQVGYKLILYVCNHREFGDDVTGFDSKVLKVKSRLQMLQNVGVPVSFIFKGKSRQMVQNRFQVVFPGLRGVKFVAHSQENVEQFFEHLYSEAS